MYMMLQQHINCKEHQESQHNTLTSPLKIFLLWFQYIPSYNNKHYNNRKNKKTTERWQKTDHLQECTTEIISKFGTKSPVHLFYTRNHSWLSVKCKNAGHLHYFKQQSDRSLKGTPSKDASRLENRKLENISICKLCTVDQPFSNTSTLLFCMWTPRFLFTRDEQKNGWFMTYLPPLPSMPILLIMPTQTARHKMAASWQLLNSDLLNKWHYILSINI